MIEQSTTAARSVLVPRLVGLEQSEAKQLLQGDGLKYRVIDQPRGSPALPQVGEVLAETPDSGTRVSTGTTVRIIVYEADQASGAVAGRLLRVGGIAPGRPVGVHGKVTATEVATGFSQQASTNSRGFFVISLPVGTYRLSGRSPQINAGQWMGDAKALVHVKVGRTSQANVYFDLK